MAWFRVRTLTAEQQAASSMRSGSLIPDLRVREKMLVLWLLHCGAKREEAATVVGVSRTTVHRYVAASRAGGLEPPQGRAITIVPRARWPPIAI